MIVDDEEFHRDDFTVVLQPFMEDIDAPRKVMVPKSMATPYIGFHSQITKKWPLNNLLVYTITYLQENGKIDMSYFAVDCFHFRTKGHRVAAAALWNNMVSVCSLLDSDHEIGKQTDSQNYPHNSHNVINLYTHRWSQLAARKIPGILIQR